MPAAPLKAIDTKRIHTYKKILDELDRLDKTLPESSLYRLAPFNSAYIVVTTAIQKTARDGQFANPKFVEKFTVCFSGYYFRVINDYLAGRELPVAWANLLSQKPDKQLPNFIYLLMGANAHINHDLSLTMLKMLDNGDTDALFKDILKVDKLLVGCGNDILRTFTETQKVARFIKDRTKYIYLPIVMHVILYWRIRAWKDYLRLKNSGPSPDRAQIKGRATSIRLWRLGSLLQR